MASAQEGARINEVVSSPSVPHSTFDLSKKFACTPKFGVNTPIYATEVVPDDGPISITPQCDLRSYTLKAPMFGKLKKHVSFYQVPLQSILPFNWDKIVKNPSRGTDVSGETSVSGVVSCLDGVNTVVSNFSYRLSQRLSSDLTLLKGYILNSEDNTHTNSEIASAILHFIVRWEMFFSHGCLLSYLGVHYGEIARFSVSSASLNDVNFDKFTEYLFSLMSSAKFSVADSHGTSSIGSGSGVLHFRKCLDFMRQYEGPFTVVVQSGSVNKVSGTIVFSSNANSDSEPLNFGRCCAYQIVNAHYLTNDKIDYIYSADLYRQYVYSLITEISGNESFIFNGVNTLYDYLSGYYCDQFLYQFTDSDTDFTSGLFWVYLYPYFNAIFGFNYS